MFFLKRNNLVFFLHIEKTAGSTLDAALAASLGDSYYKWISYPNLIKTEDIKILSQRKVIAGHFPYGVDRLLARKAHYVSLIREPIDRIESLYYYQRSTSNDTGHFLASNNDINSWLRILINQDSNLISNFQSMRLLGLEARNFNSVKAAQNAVIFLRKNFLFLDIHSNVEHLYKFLSKILNFKVRDLSFRKVNFSRPQKSEISSENLSLLKDMNKLDFHIYQSIRNKPVRRNSLSLVF